MTICERHDTMTICERHQRILSHGPFDALCPDCEDESDRACYEEHPWVEDGDDNELMMGGF